MQGLKTEKDVIKLLENYSTIAGKGLQYDIEVLVLDLKSGNFENAMLILTNVSGQCLYVTTNQSAYSSKQR